MSGATQTPEILLRILAGEVPLNSLIGLNKDEIDAIAVMAYRAYEQGQYTIAKTLFDGLIALDVKLFYGYAGRGAMALAQDRLDEAQRFLEKAHELNPKDPTVCANLGELYLRQGKFDESAVLLKKMLDLDPNGRDPGANRARAVLCALDTVIQNQLKKGRAATP